MKEIIWPEKTDGELAREMLKSIKNAQPWSTTFLFLAEGCGEVGQSTPLAKAIEQAMKDSFRIWSDSWIKSQLQDITNKEENQS